MISLLARSGAPGTLFLTIFSEVVALRKHVYATAS
jgi:hypothetical protein